jgi:hypothetical protein
MTTPTGDDRRSIGTAPGQPGAFILLGGRSDVALVREASFRLVVDKVEPQRLTDMGQNPETEKQFDEFLNFMAFAKELRYPWRRQKRKIIIAMTRKRDDGVCRYPGCGIPAIMDNADPRWCIECLTKTESFHRFVIQPVLGKLTTLPVSLCDEPKCTIGGVRTADNLTIVCRGCVLWYQVISNPLSNPKDPDTKDERDPNGSDSELEYGDAGEREVSARFGEATDIVLANLKYGDDTREASDTGYDGEIGETSDVEGMTEGGSCFVRRNMALLSLSLGTLALIGLRRYFL